VAISGENNDDSSFGRFVKISLPAFIRSVIPENQESKRAVTEAFLHRLGA